jgi:hypothetical protein
VRNTFSALMRRRLIQLALFILAGAIVNIAVAWGFISLSTGWRAHALNLELEKILAPIRTRWEPAEEQSDGTLIMVHRSVTIQPAISQLRGAWYELEVRPSAHGASTSLRAGWPALGLEGTVRHDPHYLLRSWSVSPNGVLWTGFAINTLLYAGIVWLMFAAPFVLRRRRRITRGLCPACAYPTGASDLCSECGKPVRTK